MRSQQIRAAAGYSAPLIPFASFPAALTVEGQIRRPAELPHVSLIALSGLWRPLGGRQVLAMRSINPVTVQDLAGAVAETIGPFPGGLVRAGMRLEMNSEVGHGGIGSGNRIAQSFINGALWWYTSAANSGAALELRRAAALDVISDSSAAHRRLASTTNSFTVANIPSTIVADFSAPWSITIHLTSAAETAVTITGATWSGGVATYTTSAAHTLAVADKTVVSGITPAGWNTTAIVSAVPDTTHFLVPMAVDPGAYTSWGQSSEISKMTSQSYVLELVGKP